MFARELMTLGSCGPLAFSAHGLMTAEACGAPRGPVRAGDAPRFRKREAIVFAGAISVVGVSGRRLMTQLEPFATASAHR